MRFIPGKLYVRTGKGNVPIWSDPSTTSYATSNVVGFVDVGAIIMIIAVLTNPHTSTGGVNEHEFWVHHASRHGIGWSLLDTTCTDLVKA